MRVHGEMVYCDVCGDSLFVENPMENSRRTVNIYANVQGQNGWVRTGINADLCPSCVKNLKRLKKEAENA